MTANKRAQRQPEAKDPLDGQIVQIGCQAFLFAEQCQLVFDQQQGIGAADQVLAHAFDGPTDRGQLGRPAVSMR